MRGVKADMKEFYKIANFVFNKTGQQSNLGWEYEVREEVGNDYYQYRNIYAANYEELFEYAMEDEE